MDRVENCNLESKLRDVGLPYAAKPNTHYLEEKSFANLYDLREELEKTVKADASKEKRGDSWIWNAFPAKGKSDKVEVDYNVVNFVPMIRKTKIALYLGWGKEDIDATTFIRKVR